MTTNKVYTLGTSIQESTISLRAVINRKPSTTWSSSTKLHHIILPYAQPARLKYRALTIDGTVYKSKYQWFPHIFIHLLSVRTAWLSHRNLSAHKNYHPLATPYIMDNGSQHRMRHSPSYLLPIDMRILSVCICIYIYIYIYTYVYIYIYIYMYIRIYICLWMSRNAYVIVYAYISTTKKDIHPYVQLCIYTYMYIDIYIPTGLCGDSHPT